jgi:large conductance mechanosensitive channel
MVRVAPGTSSTAAGDSTTDATGTGGAVGSPQPIPNATAATIARRNTGERADRAHGRSRSGLNFGQRRKWAKRVALLLIGELKEFPAGAAGWCFRGWAVQQFNWLPHLFNRGAQMWREFKGFILRENVLALAIAVVLGAATGKVVTAIVDDFVMPIVEAVTPAGTWQKLTVDIGAVHFRVGDFLSALLNFLVIGFVIWRISKAFLPPTPAPAGPITKPCPFCRLSVDPQASRCPHCTSELGGATAAPMIAGG